MVRSVSEESVNQVLAEIIHPEINYSLVDLRMIKHIVVTEGKVTLTLNVPLMNIPIKDELVVSIKEAIARLDATVKVVVNPAEMSQEERAKFIKMAQEGWKL